MWIVETYTVTDGWINCWNETDEHGQTTVTTFKTAEEAFSDTMDHINNLIDAQIDFDAQEFRLRRIDDAGIYDIA
jgi:hypothetical protein